MVETKEVKEPVQKVEPKVEEVQAKTPTVEDKIGDLAAIVVRQQKYIEEQSKAIKVLSDNLTQVAEAITKGAVQQPKADKSSAIMDMVAAIAPVLLGGQKSNPLEAITYNLLSQQVETNRIVQMGLVKALGLNIEQVLKASGVTHAVG